MRTLIARRLRTMCLLVKRLEQLHQIVQMTDFLQSQTFRRFRACASARHTPGEDSLCEAEFLGFLETKIRLRDLTHLTGQPDLAEIG